MSNAGRKERIHAEVQDSIQALPPFEGALLVRWVVVCEAALPDGSHAMVRMSSDAGGKDLYPWEAVGLLQISINDYGGLRDTREPRDD